MKLTMYMDVYPGWHPQYASASSSMNYPKPEGHHRLQFTIEIPDWMMATATEPDHVAAVVERAHEVDE